MKRYISILSIIILFSATVSAKARPDWVQAKPSSMIYYTGVGMANKSDKNYMSVAKSAAFNDLISEIRVEVSSNSLLQKMEENLKYNESFVQNIRTSATNDIEQFELVDSWSNSTEYWVYYQLDKKKYEEFTAKRKAEAISKGYDFWARGSQLINSGNLYSAIDMYCKGLDAIEPVMNEELVCRHNGSTINIGNELYNSLIGIFDNCAIICDPTALNAIPFHGIDTVVYIAATRNGQPLNGVKLQAIFISGSGEISSIDPTNMDGITSLKVTNITSKIARQEVQIAIDGGALNAMKNGKFKALIDKVTARMPYTSVAIQVASEPLKAYIEYPKDEIKPLADAITSYLSQNYFNIVGSAYEADVIIKIDAEFKVGAVVKGELYDMAETYSSGNITILSNANNSVILTCGVSNVRSLVPNKSSEMKAKSSATREIMKQLKKIIPSKLKEVNIERLPVSEIDCNFVE